MNGIFAKVVFQVALILFPMSLVDLDNTPKVSAIASIKQAYNSDLEMFEKSAERFSYSVSQLDADKENIEQIRADYLHLRRSYKSIEYLAEYLDPQYIKNHINGAPLPSLVPKETSIEVLQPVGLQVIEEYLYSEDPYAVKGSISEQAKGLQLKIEQLRQYQDNVRFYDRFIFEASRLHLIRIFTLGLTGFDSPGGHSIQDAYISLSRVSRDFSNYYPLISQKDSDLSETLSDLFAETLSYLEENDDFDQFDRLHFYKNYLRPLNASIVDAQMLLGVETIYEVTPLNAKHSINYLGKDIFSEDFLNKGYYIDGYDKDLGNKKILNLGKILFYDPVLSKNNERSCASCHNPQQGFTDNLPKSTAMNFEGTVDRNAPTLINAIYADKYFYDLRTTSLEAQVEHVVYDHREFNTGFLEIMDKLSQSPEYLSLFNKAYPEFPLDEVISYHTISTSLAVYVASLTSFDSEFDKYVRGEKDQIDKGVVHGFNLFMGKAQCGTCHFAPVFNGLVPPLYHESESEVLGVPATNDTIDVVMDSDPGRYRGVIRDQSDIYKNSFKTTTVRNAAITGPYMHNGVYKTLEEVIDFYNRGGGHGLGLEVPNQTLPTEPLELTEEERNNLVAFIESLTDTTGLTSKPRRLPSFPDNEKLNDRVIGGVY